MRAALLALLRFILRNNRSGSQIKNADNGSHVGNRQTPLGKLCQHLPTDDRQRHLRELTVVDRNRLDIVNENAGKHICASGGILKTTRVIWHNWSGSCWEINDSPAEKSVNAIGGEVA